MESNLLTFQIACTKTSGTYEALMVNDTAPNMVKILPLSYGKSLS